MLDPVAVEQSSHPDTLGRFSDGGGGCIDKSLRFDRLSAVVSDCHTVPAFISTVGGLILFGAPGLILGPLAVTITMLLVEISESAI